MNISELSIRRPVLATVLTIIILLFGLIGYTTLGVREYPSVDNPIISVTCSYPGANAEVIENQITEPLEQNINGIPGIRSLSSTSQQGQCRITVEFELSVDLETAANDVRDKVSRAQRYLPRDCDPPTVSKADADASPILMVAIQSNTRSLLELSEIADLTVKEQLQTIPDVSSVSIWGEKRYSMRLWLDPVKMAGYGITPVDVKNAINDQNLELPSGSIEGNTMELTLRTMGQMHTAKEFNNIILKEQNGQVVRFCDIGYAELGPADIKSYMKMNGAPHGQRQNRRHRCHSGASPCVLHQPYPDGAHHRAPGGARRLLQHIVGQQGGVAVHAAVAVGKVLGGFQPLHFVQLSTDQCL